MSAARAPPPSAHQIEIYVNPPRSIEKSRLQKINASTFIGSDSHYLRFVGFY
jgi:hypothetical protein